MCVCLVTAERICPLLGCLGEPEFGSIHYFPLLIKQTQKRRKNNLGTVPKNSQGLEKYQKMNLTSKHYNIAAWTGVLLDGHFVKMEKSKKLVVIIMQGITNS